MNEKQKVNPIVPALRSGLLVVFPIFLLVGAVFGLMRGREVFSAASLGEQALEYVVGTILFTIVTLARRA